MRYAQIDTLYYCGVDLHSRSMYITVMDKAGTIPLQQNMPNDFEIFKRSIAPFLPCIAVGAESTCFYYWLADGCQREGILFYLGHALYMKAISGGKVKNDKLDSEVIANLLRGNLFPLAYPYPREMRTTRDLLRRRHYFVRRRASVFTHLQVLCQQYGIIDLPERITKNKEERLKIREFFDNTDLQMIVDTNLSYIEALDPIIHELETQIKQQAKYHNGAHYELLKTIPGVGPILALIILYETHDINRFKTVQRY